MHVTTIPARRASGGVQRFSVRLDGSRSCLGRARPAAQRLARAILLSGVMLGGFFSACVLVLQAEAARPPDLLPATVPAPRPIIPVWIEVKRPIALFGLSGSGFSRLPLSYRARRQIPTGERLDSLTYGQFGTQGAFLSLSVLRRGAAPGDTVGFADDLGRIASSDRLSVTGGAPPTPLQTRFGAFATADLTLADRTTTQSCLGFRLESGDAKAPVGIAGIACRPSGVDRAMLACVLDRIDLLSAGEDDDLRRFFVEAERRRDTSCSVSPLLAAGSHSVWFDSDSPAPALRHLIGSRLR